MILKPRDPRTPSTDPMLRAGDEAEAQMEFYLARAFGKEPLIFILNDLRILLSTAEGGTGQPDDAMQIDHLAVHRHGMLIIESKSVSTAVRFNARGEWERQWSGRWQGMPSPVRQAQRQADALRKLLSAHRAELLGKRIFGMIQAGFKTCPIEILIAISDRGRIASNFNGDPTVEVLKAEAVTEALERRIHRHRKHSTLIGTIRAKPEDEDAGLWAMTDDELRRVADFLFSRHAPLTAPARRALIPAVPSTPPSTSPGRTTTTATSAPTSAQATTPAPPPGTAFCQHCASIQPVRGGSALFANRTYYTLCNTCGKGTNLESTCPHCQATYPTCRVAKIGPQLHRRCGFEGASKPPDAPSGCGLKEHLFTSAQ